MAPRKKATPQAEAITPAEAKNARPYDLLAEEVNEFFEQANDWLKEGKEIATEAEAGVLNEVVKGIRDLDKRIEAERKIEAKPFDDGKAEVQARYKKLAARTELVLTNVLRRLTVWRNKLAQQQAEEAARARIAAEEAADKAAHVAKMAGDDLGAQEIAKGVAEDAKRFAKTADKLETTAGTGLRMRSNFTVEIVDQKQAIATFYKIAPGELIDFIEQRLTAMAYKRSLPPGEIKGVKITETKEAY
jgi:hypothetical protein